MHSLTKGQHVIVIMARGNIFPWQSGCRFGATLIHMPRGDGDMLAVMYEDCRLEINANSPDFIALMGDDFTDKQ